MSERTCLNCGYAEIYGEYHSATDDKPAEYPEFEQCNYDGAGDIDVYLDLIDFLKNRLNILYDQDILRATYCPFYKRF